MTKPKCIFFDLGGTLVEYYKTSEFHAILDEALLDIQTFLFEKLAITFDEVTVGKRADEENRESGDNRVRPLEDRLAVIFQLDDLAKEHGFMMNLCKRFLKPILARSHVFDDTLPVLDELNGLGFRLGIVSNTPWGSPGILWREELGRIGIAKHVNPIVFDRDAGWRKPAGQIFQHAMDIIKAQPKECIYVGDDPRWDIAGPRAVGMDAVLVDRSGTQNVKGALVLKNLHELVDLVKAL
ncbi:MAG: HAD family hydrolase [Candidatus Sigynarchaeota archaeon]